MASLLGPRQDTSFTQGRIRVLRALADETPQERMQRTGLASAADRHSVVKEGCRAVGLPSEGKKRWCRVRRRARVTDPWRDSARHTASHENGGTDLRVATATNSCPPDA